MENCLEKSFHQKTASQGRKKIHKDAAMKGRVLKEELLLHAELLVHIWTVLLEASIWKILSNLSTKMKEILSFPSLTLKNKNKN